MKSHVDEAAARRAWPSGWGRCLWCSLISPALSQAPKPLPGRRIHAMREPGVVTGAAPDVRAGCAALRRGRCSNRLGVPSALYCAPSKGAAASCLESRTASGNSACGAPFPAHADGLLARQDGCAGCSVQGTCGTCMPLTRLYRQAGSPLERYCQHREGGEAIINAHDESDPAPFGGSPGRADATARATA
jgi:hypothetical protein